MIYLGKKHTFHFGDHTIFMNIREPHEALLVSYTIQPLARGTTQNQRRHHLLQSRFISFLFPTFLLNTVSRDRNLWFYQAAAAGRLLNLLSCEKCCQVCCKNHTSSKLPEQTLHHCSNFSIYTYQSHFF